MRRWHWRGREGPRRAGASERVIDPAQPLDLCGPDPDAFAQGSLERSRECERGVQALPVSRVLAPPAIESLLQRHDPLGGAFVGVGHDEVLDGGIGRPGRGAWVVEPHHRV